MTNQTMERNQIITTLLNGTNKALKHMVPIEHTISKPALVKDAIHAQFGVLIAITGDLKGKLILAGDTHTFGAIGEKMFGTEVCNDMLVSFSGEFGNMLAGNIATIMMNEGVAVDITAPSIIEGQEKVSGFILALQLTVQFSGLGNFDIYLMLD